MVFDHLDGVADRLLPARFACLAVVGAFSALMGALMVLKLLATPMTGQLWYVSVATAWTLSGLNNLLTAWDLYHGDPGGPLGGGDLDAL